MPPFCVPDEELAAINSDLFVASSPDSQPPQDPSSPFEPPFQLFVDMPTPESDDPAPVHGSRAAPIDLTTDEVLEPSSAPSTPSTPINSFIHPSSFFTPPRIERTIPARIRRDEEFETHARETLLRRRPREDDEEELSDEDTFDPDSELSDDDGYGTPVLYDDFEEFLDERRSELRKQFGSIVRRCKKKRMFTPSNDRESDFLAYARFVYDRVYCH